MDQAMLAGTWELQRCALIIAGRPARFPFGEDARGILTYSTCGTMSVAIMKSGRRRFAAADILLGSQAEQAAAAAGYLSYAGCFTVEDDYVTHTVEVSLFPNWIGTTQRRKVELQSDLLTLRAAPMIMGGLEQTGVMSWRRRQAHLNVEIGGSP